MKKLTFLMALFTIIYIGKTNAGVVITDLYKFEFNGVATSTIPSDPSITSTLYSGTSTSTSMFAVASGSCALNAGVNVLFSGGGTGARGSAIYNLNNNIALPTAKKVVLEFDWNPATTNADAMAYNALGVSDNAKNPIFVLISERWSTENSGIHLMNLTPASLSTTWMLNAATYSGTSDYKTDCVNTFSGSWLGANFPNNQIYNVKAKLDFTTHIIDSIIITRNDNPTIKYIGTNINFLSASAINADKISAVATRGRNQTNSGNGGNSMLWMTIDNYLVSTWEVAENTASVTINYKDSEGTLLKTSRVQQNLEVGTTYYATADDKATFSDENFYYAYNAAASTDNVVVAEGAVINLIFKKTAKTSGTYIWSGSTNSNWNNADENFGVGASPLMGYQDNNPILFPAVPATKTVNLNANLTIGANDITLYGDGYNFSGTGSISGTGKFILGMQPGETTTMGIRNNMAKVEINGGEAILTNDMGTATYDLADGAKITLQTGAAFSKAIAATGTATIQTNSNVFYSPTITGASTVNLILGVSGNLASVDWSSKVLTVMPTNAQVNVTTNLGSAGYGVASNSVQNSKLNLGENVRMLFNYNPAEGGGTIVYIGELKGEVGSSVEGGWVNSATRGLNYYIGGLGTDATYNGVFKNYSTAPSAPLNIFKKGSGVLTLTAANPDWILGSLKVDEGTVVLNGSIPEAGVPVTVATGAILKGTGTIDGATTVNGTLEGSLNFGSSLTLNGITKFVVNGVNEGEFDKINVTGVANVGGTIDVTVNNPSGVKGVNKVRNANPPVGTTIKLINAGSIVTSLPTVHYSSNGWTFKPATGELIYDPDNIVSGINSNVVPFSIYPTLTRDVINVEGNVKTIDVFSLTGQKVNSLVANGTKTVVNMSNLSAGAYIIRANMEDGSANMQNVILQK
jgi:hypothetical protein